MPGDFIGPEIIAVAIEITQAALELEGHRLQPSYVPASGDAFDRFGESLPASSLQDVARSGALGILKGPFGGPPNDLMTPKWQNIERDAILGLRSHFQLYANIRPVRSTPAIARHLSPLKVEFTEGVDIIIVRELLGGMYFGLHERTLGGARDTEEYSVGEVERVARVAFELAMRRSRRVTLVHKSNVLETGRLWREVVEGQITGEFPDVSYSYHHVDDFSMRLNTEAKSYDVVLTSNMFGDILSDQAATLAGGLGFCGSASVGDGKFGLFEPIHGSAPDIAGSGMANPVSALRSAAMMVDLGFGLPEVAARIDRAVDGALEGLMNDAKGARGRSGSLPEGTQAFSDRTLRHLRAADDDA